jgi:hypothetical protein
MKARHTLRKIDVISMKETNYEAIGIFTFDYSFGSDVVVPEDH